MNNMKSRIKIIIFAVSIVFIFNSTASPVYKFDFITVTDVVKKIKKTFGSLKTYQANFTIITTKMGKKRKQSGVIQYKANDKLLMKFYKPSGQKIISNGEMMWIYIPSMNVVAEQDLRSDPGLFSSGTKTGLNRLFSKYHYRFYSKKQPEEQKDGTKKYTLLLKQKESRSGYKTLKLWVSEDYMITAAEGITSSGKIINISFSNIKTNIDIPNGVFKFNIPSRARIIKNPMMSEE